MNMLSLTKLLHSTLRKIGAIISDDTMRISKMENQLFNKLNSCCRLTIANWLRLNPLSKLVNHHENVGLLILRPLERSNHIKPPNYKRPSYRDHPQLLSQHMSLSCKFLTPVALANDVLCIGMSRQLVKPVTKGFSHQRF
jgi:hypothetical protein